MKPMMDVNSLGDLLIKQGARQGNAAAMLAPTKGGFNTISYSDLVGRVRGYAGALISLGVKKGDRVVILSDNCPEWAFTDWACSSLGAVSVPIYATLPADQAQYIVQDCQASVVVAGSAEHLAKVSDLDVRTILLHGDDSLNSLSQTTHLSEGEWTHLIAQTHQDDLFTIIYTSGTTGKPKGAMLAQRAALHVCQAAMEALALDERDVFMCFLPMSHVYERIAGQCLPIAAGACIAYAKNLASLSNDIARAKPTIMLCVPRFLESFTDRIKDHVAKEKPLRQKLFHMALAQGLARSQGKFAPLAPVLDKLVLSKIRGRVGGRLRYFVSGGAALPKHVGEFLMAVGLPVLQGYGLTETAGGTCINRPGRIRIDTVGEPLNMDIRIADDGEILIKGPAVMLGYYNLPEDTAASIDQDGWFHSGDIGIYENGILRITDRKKDILVLGNGKNVAPQPIENRIKSSHLINEAVVFGDGMDHCVALIIPNPEHLRKEAGIADDILLSESKEARAMIKRELDGINKTVAPFEMVKRFAILDQPFTIESGEMTPTMKVKRKVVRDRNADLIKSLG